MGFLVCVQAVSGVQLLFFPKLDGLLSDIPQGRCVAL